MRRTVAHVLVALAAWTAGAGPLAAEQLSLSVDRTRLTLDDEAYVTISLEGDFSEYQPPAGDCFELSSPSQSTSLSIVNGRRSQTAQLQYRLTPTREGTCVVGPAKVHTARGWVPTNSVQLTITRGAEAPRITAEEAQVLSKQVDEPYFLRPVVPTRALHPGEPFVLGYDLWVRQDVALSDAGLVAEPSLPGFLSEDLLGGRRPKGRRQAIGRTVYSVFPMARVLATPLKAGQTELGALEAQLVIGDVFRARRYKARSPIVTLIVKPLPEAGRPSTFDAGSIGTFTLAGAIDKARVSLGEALVYTLTLQGTGNLERMNAPPFPTVDGLTASALPSGADDQVVKDLEGMHGMRRFQYVLRPTREGRLELPPVGWAVFDPTTDAYVTLQTAPLALDVTAALPTAGGAHTAAPQAAALTDDERLPPLVEDPGPFDATRAPAAPARTPPLVALGLLALALLAVELRHRRRAHRTAHRAEYARAGALAAAERALKAVRDDDPRAARRLHEAVTGFLADRLRVEPGRLALAELERATREAGVPAELASALRELLEALEQAAWVPTGASGAAELRARALRLLEEVVRAHP